MKKATISAVLLVVGMVNTVPVIGVAGRAALASLYGVDLTDPALLLLMRHRAVLLGLLGAALLAAVFSHALRVPAIAANLAAMLAFVCLAVLDGEVGSKFRLIMLSDLASSAGLLVALGLHLASRSASFRR